MADGTKANVDLSSVMQGLDKLASPAARESLARRMAVAGGRVFRDEAKRQVPVDTGLLQSAIYVAFRDAESKGGVAQYRVAWNSRVAPHGHLIEFGHWQTHAWGHPMAQPKWTPAKPFMRPALSIGRAAATDAMMDAGREAFADILRDQYTPGDEAFV